VLSEKGLKLTPFYRSFVVLFLLLKVLNSLDFFRFKKVKMLNPELFQFLKIKPLLEGLDMSPARFTQKLYRYKIRGIEQRFTETELAEIKRSLRLITAIIDEETQKI
jgi:hypothetical protein